MTYKKAFSFKNGCTERTIEDVADVHLLAQIQ
jgi:hypothetical protein